MQRPDRLGVCSEFVWWRQDRKTRGKALVGLGICPQCSGIVSPELATLPTDCGNRSCVGSPFYIDAAMLWFRPTHTHGVSGCINCFYACDICELVGLL